jgi:magnesium-transporting ATPase (P-type)
MSFSGFSLKNCSLVYSVFVFSMCFENLFVSFMCYSRSSLICACYNFFQERHQMRRRERERDDWDHRPSSNDRSLVRTKTFCLSICFEINSMTVVRNEPQLGARHKLVQTFFPSVKNGHLYTLTCTMMLNSWISWYLCKILINYTWKFSHFFSGLWVVSECCVVSTL